MVELTKEKGNLNLNQRDFSMVFHYFDNIGLSRTGKDFLEAHLQLQEFQNRSTILQAGTTFTQLAFILKGQCREYIKRENEREYTYQFYLQHQWMLNGSFIQQCPAMGTIQALGKVRLAVLPRTAFETFCTLFPEGRQFQALLAEQVACAHETHLINLLSKNATERYNFLTIHRPELINAFAGLHLSSFIKIRPESLSRIRRDKLNKKNDNV